jgi:hypothetical protein
MPGVLRETVLDTASVMLLICAASAFGFYLAWERLPPAMATWMVGLTSDPTLLLLLINVLLIVLGTAVEGTAALIILTPIFVPVILNFGIDPVHFGIVLVTNLTIAGHHAAGRADDVHLLRRAAGADGGLHGGDPALPRRDVRGAGAHHLRAPDIPPAAGLGHGALNGAGCGTGRPSLGVSHPPGRRVRESVGGQGSALGRPPTPLQASEARRRADHHLRAERQLDETPEVAFDSMWRLWRGVDAWGRTAI